MNGQRGPIIAVISVGVALGGLILNSQRSLEAAIEDNTVAIRELQEDVADIRERMARLEGRVDLLVEIMVKERDQ